MEAVLGDQRIAQSAGAGNMTLPAAYVEKAVEYGALRHGAGERASLACR